MRHDIVTAARSWLGTPYVHQASCQGAGADCLGLVRGLWRQIYGAEPEAIPAYSWDWSEPQRQERLWLAARRHLQPVPMADMGLGDVLLFRMRSGAVAKHLGVVSFLSATKGIGSDRFIHAYARHGVVESNLTAPWRRRVVACFAFPETGAAEG